MITHPISKGDRLFLIMRRSRGGDGKHVTVEKIGRSWITLSTGDRIDVDTLELEDSWGGQEVFRTEAEAADNRNATMAWIATYQGLGAQLPEGLTFEKVQAIRALLGFEPFTISQPSRF